MLFITERIIGWKVSTVLLLECVSVKFAVEGKGGLGVVGLS